ncbi:hypothetical protein O181_020428 [Austropuccinia psidii MF-1]|uniref:DUF4939 domain-containing protein n=1 Tax=Austropuccinia psidii MF-1 TaxID=1389203 RepID=A0A9Q3GUH9_9BASI|nr:hypothetical protein [Austropuccinia psidii MF-1]
MASAACGPQSVDHGPQSMGPLSPFWPKFDVAKRRKGGIPLAPKARWVPNHKWAHLSQVWPQSQQSQKWPRTIFWKISTPGLWKPPQAIRSGLARFPLNSGEELSFTNLLHTKRSRQGEYMKYNPCYIFILLEPSKQRRSQARSQADLTPTPRTTSKSPGEDGEEEEGNSLEEEESEGTEGVPAPVGESQGTGGPTLAQSNQPVSHQSEPSLLVIMQQMTQIMPNLQEASSFESSRSPAFKTSSIKASELFDVTKPFEFRSFIQSCELIFHNNLINFSQDRKKVLYATSFPIGKAEKWIEPYLSNITNPNPSYLLNSWKLF